MSPEAQRIAIADVCGWKPRTFCVPYLDENGEESGTSVIEETMPDYLNDLNAMHEAERLLDSTSLQAYMENLIVACLGDSANGDGSIEEQWIVCHASASLRAKAFLQTWGKWHE